MRSICIWLGPNPFLAKLQSLNCQWWMLAWRRKMRNGTNVGAMSWHEFLLPLLLLKYIFTAQYYSEEQFSSTLDVVDIVVDWTVKAKCVHNCHLFTTLEQNGRRKCMLNRKVVRFLQWCGNNRLKVVVEVVEVGGGCGWGVGLDSCLPVMESEREWHIQSTSWIYWLARQDI